MSVPLSADRWKTLEPLIDAAVELAPDARQAFVRKACRGDAALEADLVGLLAEYDRVDAQFDRPAAERFPSLMDDDALLPKVFDGRYRIERELGRGGMATVYVARDLRHERDVAVKVLHPDLAAALGADRFLSEIKTTARLQHPHILALHDSGEADGFLFYVMPLVDGMSLRRRLEHEAQLPIDEVVRIASEVASALDAAHKQGVIHRDIKPENILLHNGAALVADFGIALALAEGAPRKTHSGLALGTPQYMSPEQATGGGAIDARADVYALGTVVFEMLAGEPPFTGATSSAILAKRAAVPAPPVRVLRPAVTAAMDAAVAKALAREPVDRWRTAGEFVEALQNAMTEAVVPTAIAPIPTSVGGSRRGLWIALSAVLVLAAALSTQIGTVSRWFAPQEELDTTRIAILPTTGLAQSDVKAEDLLSEAMRRWRGLIVVQGFEVSDAVRRAGVPRSTKQARDIARSVGAGRYIQAAAATTGSTWRMSATLFDTRSGKDLYDAKVDVPRDSLLSPSTYSALGDALALRAAPDEDRGVSPRESQSLPMLQLMPRAVTALSEWNLPAAESLYTKAIEYDPASVRAAFWIAQIRAWRSQPPESWRELAVNAAREKTELTLDEQRLASALAALGEADYQRACDIYRALTHDNPRDFAAWFGLGQCLDFDRTVIADSAAKSGWRFRTSYEQAVQAYVRAFELLPSVYRGYQGTAYVGLLSLLYVSTRYLRIGTSPAAPQIVFMGLPTINADTLAFQVVPASVVASGVSERDVAATAAAVTHMRTLFYRITSGWAATFPTSSGAKEGLALAMELRGDPAAIDTVRAALKVARDPKQRLRLQGTLVWLELKFGLPDRLDLLRAARATADSALRTARPTDKESRDVLGRFAALTGRCALAAQYARQDVEPLRRQIAIPQDVVGDAQARVAYAALGCAVPDSFPTLNTLSLRASLDRLPGAVHLAFQQQLFGREVRTADLLDTTWAARLAPAGDYLIVARLAAARRDTAAAHQRLQRMEELRRRSMPGDVTPDATVPEARLLLDVGDTASAVRWLDRALNDARYFPPMFATETDNLVLIASTIRAMAMRAALAHDRNDAARWSRAVLALWDGADPSLQPTIRRMQGLAGK